MTGCCKTCSILLYGEDLGDFAGLVGPALFDEGYGLLVDCDECGPVIVGPNGERALPQPCDA